MVKYSTQQNQNIQRQQPLHALEVQKVSACKFKLISKKSKPKDVPVPIPEFNIQKFLVALEIPKRVALNKLALCIENKKKFIEQELGPSMQELILTGFTFTTPQIFCIGLRLLHTIIFLEKQDKVIGGILPQDIYFSRDLSTFYLMDLERITHVNKSDKSINYYKSQIKEKNLKSVYNFGSQNLRENIIPCQRDQMQNILNLMYYLMCHSNGKKFIKHEITESILKQIYYSIKSFKFQDNVFKDPIVNFFASKSIPLVLSKNLLSNTNFINLKKYLTENSHRHKAFENIVRVLETPINEQKTSQIIEEYNTIQIQEHIIPSLS